MTEQTKSGLATPAFQNPEVAKLSRQAYTLADLETIRKALVEHGTLTLRCYKSGGASAVTVPSVDELKLSLVASTLLNINGDRDVMAQLYNGVSTESLFQLQKASSGLLILGWDRDRIMQAVAELTAVLDPDLGDGLAIEADAWKRGLRSCLAQHFENQNRFLDIIDGRASGMDMGAGPQIRFNPITLTEVKSTWGHRQNDALASIVWLLYFGLNRGYLSWDDEMTQLLATAYTCLTHQLWRTTCLPVDQDLGAWEDKKAQHASSLLVAVAALKELLSFLQGHGMLSYRVENRQFDVHENGIRELIKECEAQLAQILPNEFIRADADTEIRSVDSALVNGLFFGAVSGQPVVNDAMALLIIANLERYLRGHIGFRRYPRDRWDGRDNRYDLAEGEEAQWSHVAPMISYILGDMYRRSNDERYLAHQTNLFNWALACVNERWNVPEAYIVDRQSRQWVPDENEPLAWAQAMLLMSIAGMKASLTHQQSLAAAAQAAATEARGQTPQAS